jgi:hypothetical protein
MIREAHKAYAMVAAHWLEQNPGHVNLDANLVLVVSGVASGVLLVSPRLLACPQLRGRLRRYWFRVSYGVYDSNLTTVPVPDSEIVLQSTAAQGPPRAPRARYCIAIIWRVG